MELHPFLEHDTVPASGIWYVISSHGPAPSVRVGHEAVVVKTDSGEQIYVIRGADPGECFSDTYIFDMSTLTWVICRSVGIRARYEHAGYVPESQPRNIYIFGGADQAGNMNDVEVLNTTNEKWSTCDVKGNPPSARTHHTSAVVGDLLIVYSGGYSGVDPVGDRQLHYFDAATCTWGVLDVHGESPKPRHGHVMAAVGRVVFLHGGMAGTTFYDDLHMLDYDKKRWSAVKKKANRPSARAAHGSAVYDKWVYMFGGMNRDGALDDLYRLDTTSLTWTKVNIDGPPPPARLDFAMCIVELSRAVGTIPDGGGERLLQASAHAKEVIERELKPGSASSRGSGSGKFGDDPPLTTPEDKSTTDLTSERPTGPTAADLPPHLNHDDDPPRPQEMFHLCVIHGGTDTNGHLFDDLLCIRIDP